MNLVRSDSPEVARSVASSGARSGRKPYKLLLGCAANLPGLLIVLALSLVVSVRAAAWVSLPVLLVLNGFVLWRLRVSHRTWVIVGCADRLYVRLFAWRNGEHGEVHDRDLLVLEAPDVASMSIRTVEVFLHGPKPKFVEWLVIEPAQTVAEDVSRYLRPLLTLMDPDKVVLVANEGGGASPLNGDGGAPPCRYFSSNSYGNVHPLP